MYPIKQSAALTVPFFAHDAAGDAVTGLTDGTFTKRISKNGAAFGAMTATISEMENGWYSFPLSASHSDTLGLLTIVFTNGSAKQVNLQFRVHARLPDDLAHPTTSGRSIDVTATGAVGIDWGNVENPTTAVDLSGTDIQLCDTVTTNTDMRGTDGGALASVCTEARLAELDAANLPADVAAIPTSNPTAAAIADQVWDEAKAGHVGIGSFGEEVQAHALTSEVAAVETDTQDIQSRLPVALVGGRMDSDVGAKTGNVALSAQEKLDVNAECDTALVDYDAAIPADIPTAAAVADQVWDEAKAGHVGVGSFGEEVQAHALTTEVSAVETDTQDIQSRLPAALVGGRMDSDVGAKTGNVALSTQEKADVNAEVVDALATDTYAESAAVPAATASLKDKIVWLATLARNKITQTGTTKALRNDADSADIATSTVSDDGTTFTHGEFT